MKNCHRYTRPVLALALLLSVGELTAQTSIFGQVRNSAIRMDLSITQAGIQSERDVEIYVRVDGETVQVLSRIMAPSFLRNLRYLVYQDEEGERQVWARGSSGVRQLPAGAGGERLFNSDFVSDDFLAMENLILAGQQEPLPFDPSQIVGIPGRHSVAVYLKEGDTNFRVYVETLSGMVLGFDELRASGPYRSYRVQSLGQKGEDYFPREASVRNFENNSESRFVVQALEFPAELPIEPFLRQNL